jgi:hypothetical protein
MFNGKDIFVQVGFLYFWTLLKFCVMPDFDFKRFHIRSMNAASGEERAAINQELKDLYASLSEVDKTAFNDQLQKFLISETARVKSDYESIHGLNSPN